MADQQVIYQIKVSLRKIKPPIWRTLLVPAGTRLTGLHRVLQVAMGWENYHLHLFNVAGVEYGERHPEWPEVRDERRVSLGQLGLRRRSKFTYEYDMGDGWQHDIVVEALVPPDKSLRYPVCTEGARACPPEDVGGPFGYQDFLAAIADPHQEEHDSMTMWAGEDFDPERFDKDSVNALLHKLRYDLGARPETTFCLPDPL